MRRLASDRIDVPVLLGCMCLISAVMPSRTVAAPLRASSITTSGTISAQPQVASVEAKKDSQCVRAAPADTIKRTAITATQRRMWDSTAMANIQKHLACVGMTEDMLRAAWGLPQTIHTSIGPGMEIDRYVYLGGTVILENHSIKAIRRHRSRAS